MWQHIRWPSFPSDGPRSEWNGGMIAELPRPNSAWPRTPACVPSAWFTRTRFSAAPRFRVKSSLGRSRASAKQYSRPQRFALVAQRLRSSLHRNGERDEIEPAIIFIRRREPQPLLDPFHGRPPLSRLRVEDADAELEKDADEIRLVADAFEEQLLEAVARFEVVAVVEKRDAAEEARVVRQFHVSDRSWSRFTLPPESTTATREPGGSLINPCRSAATGAAAAPSTTSLQRSMIQIIASKISRSGRATISSTKRWTTEKLISPSRRTRSPSMIVLQSIVSRCPASRLAFIAGPSLDSTPMTRMFGLWLFIAIETPEISPPPPIGTMTASSSGQSWMISRPSVPWPAMSCSSSNGWTYVSP